MNAIPDPKRLSLFVLMAIIVVCLCSFCEWAGDNEEKYKAYQAKGNVGKAALSKENKAVVLGTFSQVYIIALK